ncbi:hypothetical protein [Burkholderia contaminans]|uniref:hypothetical protein n=1 Tax=Burkholderia contaminans TaxID=488447 RepID=UPI0014536538|nr:hypothetical protein [Burkholderia contaminans]VWC74932.1 hypothetical protein BCO18442_00824 [Burkholderia contaminans]
MIVNSVMATRMSIHNQDGKKVAEFLATSSGKMVHKSDIREFAKEVKKVVSDMAKIKDSKADAMSKCVAQYNVAKALNRCKSMSERIGDGFNKTTYRHNQKKIKKFSAVNEMLADLERQKKAMERKEGFEKWQSERNEEMKAISAEQRSKRRELLKNNPDANFNGGMVR